MGYIIDYGIIKKKLEKCNAKRVLVQFPDGLKKDYKVAQEELSGPWELHFWAGSCFGACDIPVFIENFGFDAIIHLGHFKFQKSKTLKGWNKNG